MTFNSPDDLVAILRAIGIQDEQYSKHLPQLAAMMARRHQIVHRADLPTQDLVPDPIAREQVREWAQAVFDFTAHVLRGIIQLELKDVFGQAGGDATPAP